MIDNANDKIDALHRKYDMLMKSIIFSNVNERENIYYELNKIEKQILDDTNKLYNEEYDKLFNTKTSLFNEEKDRLVSLIELIENRRRFVMTEIDRHRRNTGINLDFFNIKGTDEINLFQKKIRIIDKYNQNIKLKNKLINELDILKDKLNKSEVKIRSNDRINKELENKLIDMFEKSFKALEIYSYKEREEEINLAFNELSYARDKAIQNLNGAKNSNDSVLLEECEKMFDSVEEEYLKYFEKKMLLKLIYIYDKTTNNYDELFSKRDEINNILSQIDTSDFYKLVFNEVNKQYNTIKLEQQDMKTYISLQQEKTNKERLLNEIEKENNSEEFADVLDELLKNEKIKQEKEEQIRRRKEYEERQKRLIEDSKKQDEIRKKQKKIEEIRKRDIELRTKEMLEKQKTGVINKLDVDKEIKEKISAKPASSVVKKSNDNVIEKLLKQNDENKVIDTSVKKINKDDNFDKSVKLVDKDMVIGKDKNNDLQNDIFAIGQESKEKELKENKYDNIMADTDNNMFDIPVIKNDKLVAKKSEEKIENDNDVHQFMKRFLDNNSNNNVDDGKIDGIVFPDMPI